MQFKNIFLLIGFAAIITINSCVKDRAALPPAVSTTLPSNCDTTNVTYTNSIGTIMTTYCNSGGACHNNTGHGTPYNFTTYAGVFANMNNGSNSIYYRVFIEASNSSLHMPNSISTGPQSLSVCDAAKLKAWINKGGPQ
ncbi:MAG: hypothetical protein ABI199_02445 [Bacteroidia bacterium]